MRAGEDEGRDLCVVVSRLCKAEVHHCLDEGSAVRGGDVVQQTRLTEHVDDKIEALDFGRLTLTIGRRSFGGGGSDLGEFRSNRPGGCSCLEGSPGTQQNDRDQPDKPGTGSLRPSRGVAGIRVEHLAGEEHDDCECGSDRCRALKRQDESRVGSVNRSREQQTTQPGEAEPQREPEVKRADLIRLGLRRRVAKASRDEGHEADQRPGKQHDKRAQHDGSGQSRRHEDRGERHLAVPRGTRIARTGNQKPRGVPVRTLVPRVPRGTFRAEDEGRADRREQSGKPGNDAGVVTLNRLVSDRGRKPVGKPADVAAVV